MATTFYSFSQASGVNIDKQHETGRWITIYSGEGVYNTPFNDTSHSRYFFKYENTSNQEFQYTTVIPANTTYSFDENHNDKSYFISIKNMNITQLK